MRQGVHAGVDVLRLEVWGAERGVCCVGAGNQEYYIWELLGCLCSSAVLVLYKYGSAAGFLIGIFSRMIDLLTRGIVMADWAYTSSKIRVRTVVSLNLS